MRLTHLVVPLLLACGQAWSQSPATPPSAAPESRATEVEPRIERIHVEDSGARIDELRVGGDTKRIDVQPKGGMPAYQVAPKTGERTWQVFGF